MPTLSYHEVATLPRLAWLAVVDRGGGRARVFHGSAVECRDRWMVEGVWDGDFAGGGFHDSAHFFGSGIRVEGDRLLFVPSSALVDRLLYCRHRGRVLVSNSLVLLLAFTHARLDPGHDYRAEATAIRQGAQAYSREFVVIHPEIPSFFQVYDECLVVEHDGLRFATLREAPRIESFAQYRDLVAGTLGWLHHNYSSPDRRAPMAAFVTLSSGYDSAAVAALVSALGVETCFTARRSNSYLPLWLSPSAARDDGTSIARTLGLAVVPLDPRRSRVTEDELFFLAPGCAQPALVFHSMTRLLAKRSGAAVLFTGFQGDEVWDTTWEQAYHQRGVIRGDSAALGLSEIRLKSGFINLAVPALCARRIRDVAGLGVAPEMEPWRMHDAYDRPIPRRIVETAGIARGGFARRKKAVVRTYPYPVNRALRSAFFRWLGERRGLTPAFLYLHVALNRVVFFLVRSRQFLRLRLFPEPPRRRPPTPHVFLWKSVDLPGLMFQWAAESLAAHFAPALEAARAAQEPERSRSAHRAPVAP
jgi:hypothetical protein